jgi:hypothetical protein
MIGRTAATLLVIVMISGQTGGNVDFKKVIAPTHVSAGFLLLTGLVILAWSFPEIFRIGAPPRIMAAPRPNVAVSPAPPAPAADLGTLQKLATEADIKYANLQAQLEYNARNAENLGKLLAFLTFFTSVFALAIAANSYVGFREILRSANEELSVARKHAEDMPKKFDDVKAEIYASYPLLQNVDASLRELVTTLHYLLPADMNWREDIQLSEADRQRGFTAELTVALFEVFQLGRLERYRRSASEIYQGLALFYGNQAVRGLSHGQAVYREAPEIQRALFYIDKACTIDDKNAAAFRDFGALHAAREDFNSAERKYKESLVIDSEEPGALFGLAYIQAKIALPPDLTGAIQQMNALIDKKRWEARLKKKYLAEAYTNRACYRALLASTLTTGPVQDAGYFEAMQDLQDGYTVAKNHQILKNWQTRANDERTKIAGDLVELDRRFKAQIDPLLT